MSNGPETLYTAEGTAVGGREGHSRTSDGRLDVDLDVPAEMGGTCGLGTNPEQLLAAGWAACFQSSMQRFAFACKVDLSDSRVTSRVGIGTLESGGFGLAAALDFHAPQVSRADAVELMRRARTRLAPTHGRRAATSRSRSPSAARTSSCRQPDSHIPHGRRSAAAAAVAHREGGRLQGQSGEWRPWLLAPHDGQT
jgi:osmotically inducible protein OsmC